MLCKSVMGVFVKWRTKQVFISAVCGSVVSIACCLNAEEPIFAIGSNDPFAASHPHKRDAEFQRIGHDGDVGHEKAANNVERDLHGYSPSDLRADGGGGLPQPIDWSTRHHIIESHAIQTPGAYDIVGSQIGADDPNRPRYPYNATEDWAAHASDPESWGDLAELPYVQLGWFANAEASVYAPRVLGQFQSDTLLDNAFPNNPIVLSVAPLNVSVSPRIEIGYRYERGLGETRFGYQFYDFRGNDTIPDYDLGSPAQRSSHVSGQVFDLDFCELEFNAENIPLIHPIFKFAGRSGLGRPLSRQVTPPPLEMRFLIGGRGANYFTETEAVGLTTSDHVSSNFWGGGLHFTWDLNQRLRHDVPFYWHLRAEGSGAFGRLDQKFSRTRGAVTAVATDPQSWIGVPTVSLEAGLSWAPQLPCRKTRVTLAYHYEQWFSYGQGTVSDTNLILNGILLRGEWKF